MEWSSQYCGKSEDDRVKRVIIIFIAARSVVAALYDVNIAGPIRITDVAGVFLPIFLLGFIATRIRNLDFPGKKLIIFMVFWMFISAMYHNLSLESQVPVYIQIKQILRFLNGAVVFLAFPFIFTTIKDAEHLLIAFLVSSIFPLVQAFGGYFFGISSFYVGADIDNAMFLTGVYGNYGMFVLVAVSGALAAMYFLNTAKEKYRKWFVILIVLYVAIGLMTLSRTTIFILAIIATGVIFTNLRGSRFKNLLLLGMAFTVFLTTSFFGQQWDTIERRSAKEFEVLEGTRDVSQGFHGRIGRWEDSFESFYYDYGFTEKVIGTDIYIGPHGDYAYWLLSYGMIGISLYLLFMFTMIRYSLLYSRRAQMPKIRALGQMVFIAWLVWAVTAIATNSSFMPDYSYFIIGNTAVFFGLYLRKNENKDPALR